MKKNIHIIWDLDGTLINSAKEFLEVLVKSVREAGFSEKENKYSFRAGPTIDIILDNAFGKNGISPEKKQEIIALFRHNYDNCGFDNTPAFDGIERILKNGNFMHHIVTNKPDLATNRILEKLGWKKYFASVITPYTYIKPANDERKNKPELFALCMADYHYEKFVGVGDMDTDAKAAIENKIPAIGVLWGTGNKEELAICDYVVDNIESLESLLFDLNDC